MASLYLIRHGQASFGTDDYDRLSVLGHRQSALTGEYLTTVGVKFGAAYSGTALRQRDTARGVLSAYDEPPALQIDPRFNEVNLDEQLQALTPLLLERDSQFAKLVEQSQQDSKTFQKVVAATFGAWVKPNCPKDLGIQSWDDYRNDVQAALERVIKETVQGTDTAIFTSGGTIATLVSTVLQLSSDKVYSFYEPVFNCSITRIIFGNGRRSLSNFNDIAHLRFLGAQLREELVTYR